MGPTLLPGYIAVYFGLTSARKNKNGDIGCFGASGSLVFCRFFFFLGASSVGSVFEDDELMFFSGASGFRDADVGAEGSLVVLGVWIYAMCLSGI
jgi:hypothetical protein